MRLNMHRETPAAQKIPEKMERVLLIFAWGLLIIPFLVIAAVCIYERQIVIGLLLGAVGVLMGLFGAHLYMNEKRSYIEINGGEIRVVEYIWCRPREGRFEISQIGEIRNCDRRYGKSSLPYIRVSGRAGMEMFSIYRCPESEKVFSKLVESVKE